MTTETETQTSVIDSVTSDVGSLALRGSYEPLKPTGVLDHFKFSELTPVIGRQYEEEVQLSELLNALNRDELLRELAIIVSRRNVVFFKNQTITPEQQSEIAQLLGEVSGKPKDSKLHIHPLTQPNSKLGDRINVIESESEKSKEYVKLAREHRVTNVIWHTDITYEHVPSDFALLKIHTLPETGGDTLWASAYEAYDRLTPAFQKFVEGLTAVHAATNFHVIKDATGAVLRDHDRGSPANKGLDFTAVHPVVRTNPITGWKGLFVSRLLTKYIVELSRDESEKILETLYQVQEQHDLQVRFKWSKNDLALWSNTSSIHTATADYGKARRVGDRAVSIGEKPYLDPNSKSRRADLGLPSYFEDY
ncbi:taurine catabolism dioxygenase [Meredithblackwellia eburnea MCA 4105]